MVHLKIILNEVFSSEEEIDQSSKNEFNDELYSSCNSESCLSRMVKIMKILIHKKVPLLAKIKHFTPLDSDLKRT